MIADIFLLFSSISISIFTIVYIITHQQNYGSKKNITLIILLYIFIGLLYFTLFSLSTIAIFNEVIALTLWNITVIINLSALIFLSSLHGKIIGDKKTEYLNGLIFSFLGGIIVYFIFFGNGFEEKKIAFNYYFTFDNSLLFYFIVLVSSLIVFLMWYILIINYLKIRNRILARLITLNTLCFTFNIYSYILFLLFPFVLFLKYFHLISYIITGIVILYEIIKKPDLFIDLTNKIYDFIIFHKSGILLYSYNFETGTETDDSLLKGSILIGINHILSNLTNQKNKLGIIKMENRDLVLQYDDKYGFAILLITNKKIEYIDKSIQQFMEKFVDLNRDELNSLSGLIDTSQFKNAGKLIQNYFSAYIQ